MFNSDSFSNHNDPEKSVTGCRFYLSIMSDHYIEILLHAINQVNTNRVFATRDKTSTVYRGCSIHVLDCLQACFHYAYRENIHMTLEATFSKGCPEDTKGDFVFSEEACLNQISASAPVLSKISFYPLGDENYMEHIAHIIKLADNRKIFVGSKYYVSFLAGKASDIFDYLQVAIDYANNACSHYALEVTLSVNSPS